MNDKSDINLKAIIFFISSYCIKTSLPEVPEKKFVSYSSEKTFYNIKIHTVYKLLILTKAHHSVIYMCNDVSPSKKKRYRAH